jgi:hypothetical protein
MMTRAKKSITTRLPIKANASKSRKLSLEQQGIACQKLATGLRPRVVAEQMRKEHGVQASPEAYANYLRTHATEIAQYRKSWNENVRDKVHLRFSGARLIELVKAYYMLLRLLFRVMCPTCLGGGVTSIKSKSRKEGELSIARRCRTCKGCKWVVAKEADTYELGDDAAAGALRLATIPMPINVDPAVWDRMAAILRQIREEVGDAKQDKGSSGEDLEAVARIAALQAMTSKLSQMTSEEFSAFCRSQLGSRQELPTMIDGVITIPFETNEQ